MSEENTQEKPAEEPSELESSAVEKETESLRSQVDELNDKYLRAIAELENYKKRAIKERSELIKYSGESLARDLLDIVDDFERALNQNDSGALEDGLKLIHAAFVKTLQKHQIKAQSGMGEKFDPNTQDAIGTSEKEGVEADTVIEEFKKAYFLKDKLLRPGQVVVSE